MTESPEPLILGGGALGTKRRSPRLAKKGGGGGGGGTVRGRGKNKTVAQVQTFGFVHVGGGGTGKRYTATSAEKAAKKMWRECKHLAVIEVKGSDGNVQRFKAADWAGKGPQGGKKFQEKGRSHRVKSAAFAKGGGL